MNKRIIPQNYITCQMKEIEIGDFIKSKTCGLCIGEITGEGVISKMKIPVWIIHNVHGKIDAIPKDDAVLLGYAQSKVSNE